MYQPAHTAIHSSENNDEISFIHKAHIMIKITFEDVKENIKELDYSTFKNVYLYYFMELT